VFQCIRPSFLDLICKIIEGHYFIWKLTVVTSCQLVYRIDVAHPADGRRASANSGKKRHKMAVQRQTGDGSGVWRTSRGTIGSVLLHFQEAGKERCGVLLLVVGWSTDTCQGLIALLSVAISKQLQPTVIALQAR
jgi:hypothetical protein